MAVRKHCNQEMTGADGCIEVPLYCELHALAAAPVPVGDPRDLLDVMAGGRCHDCGALTGCFHHPGCDSEACPHCGAKRHSGQAMIECG